MTAPALWSVSPFDVVRLLFGAAAPAVTVRNSRPDDVPGAVPLVVVRRTGGSSTRPRFWDRPFLNFQCWAGPDLNAGVDAERAAELLADQVRQVLFEAWQAQTVTAAGWISRVVETEGPESTPDPDLPLFGRYTATYEVLFSRHRT